MKTKTAKRLSGALGIGLIILALTTACSSKQKHHIDMSDGSTYVEIKTTVGDIVIKLYDETPLHRDNFVKLAEEGTYEGTLFHRVIKDFMVQAGDPDSKTAEPGQQLGSGDVGYTIPAEFRAPDIFHKRGTIAAARTGDEVNPEKESSGCQFYIVTGQVYSDSLLTQLETNVMLKQKNHIFTRLIEENKDEINKLSAKNDRKGLMDLQVKLNIEADSEFATLPVFTFTDEQREAYTTVGGTPFLDGEYTVFGEVVSGMEVVEEIEGAATDNFDRPQRDIKIKKVTVLK